MKDHVRIAGDYFIAGNNCAQAVCAAWHEEMGVDEKAALRMSSAFGGGMGRLREVCGAMSGALLVLGALRGYDVHEDSAKKELYSEVQDFAARFKAQLGSESYLCRDLLGGVLVANPGTPVPQARDASFYADRPCLRCVETAARVLEEMLAE